MESVSCKDARIDIALMAGNDLDAAGEQKLKRHLAACPHCRDHWQSMRRSVRVLQEPAEHPVRLADSSLWPSLSRRLPQRERRRRSERFNGWGPAVAVLAACSLLLMFAGGPDGGAPMNSRSSVSVPSRWVNPVVGEPPVHGISAGVGVPFGAPTFEGANPTETRRDSRPDSGLFRRN